jgi:hypothetical protein
VKVTVETTNAFATVNGIRCREWRGTAEDGSQVTLFTYVVRWANGKAPEGFLVQPITVEIKQTTVCDACKDSALESYLQSRKELNRDAT